VLESTYLHKIPHRRHHKMHSGAQENSEIQTLTALNVRGKGPAPRLTPRTLRAPESHWLWYPLILSTAKRTCRDRKFELSDIAIEE
jgi:hypothetical protein